METRPPTHRWESESGDPTPLGITLSNQKGNWGGLISPRLQFSFAPTFVREWCWEAKKAMRRNKNDDVDVGISYSAMS